MTETIPTQDDLTHGAAAFRRFNRIYTRFIGTLNEGLLETSFSLTEARILYEIATRKAANARAIAEALSLDPGYLSRILARFESDGLTARKPSPHDARASIISLTRKGKSAFTQLDSRSERQAMDVLESLPLTARSELLNGMQTIERLLVSNETGRPIVTLRPHRVGDMGWVVYSESTGYARQYGWNEEFESLVAKIVGEFLTSYDPARERCWIAEIDGASVGHIFLVKHPTELDTARLRLLYIEPAARGLGLGETLVRECLRFAETAGYTRVVLWTQSILTAAHRIYAKAGFRLVKETPHTNFGKHLTGQEWELALPSPAFS
ncbi:GNAT family N-acetyltransferase [Acidicapsa dinghuensis]|uniref:GNAT family N-acetyltransferase n=1 Tax=Acidicapsa dinghuensis TaxID=2218256 RepID=A0ABW1ENR8_9BACT|nr:helix-turn-helix domain-containing GNAT family N-acetyltransferase [Acidicapsa dinghuensis]